MFVHATVIEKLTFEKIIAKKDSIFLLIILIFR